MTPSRLFVLATTIILATYNPYKIEASSSGSKSSTTTITLKSNGIGKSLSQTYRQAVELASQEQEVEDYNAILVSSASNTIEAGSKRRLICLPLDERFDKPMGSFSHGHVQTGDKASLPRNFWNALKESKAEVPWLFLISRVEGVTKPMVEDDQIHNEVTPSKPLQEVVAGPLDFRAPSNYCFLPLWMMRAMRLHPRDIVEVKLTTTIPAGSHVKFRPHTSDFVKDISNAQAVLETELRHYSSLTKGSTIAFDYNGKRYWVDVEELLTAPRGEKAPLVKVQDCDVASDFLTSKEEVKRKREERKRKLEERKANQESS